MNVCKDDLETQGKLVRIVRYEDTLAVNLEEVDKYITLYVMTLEDYGLMKGIASPVNLAEVIEEFNKETCISHLVVDEFNGEHLKDSDAVKIQNILTSGNLQQSYIYIILQPLSMIQLVAQTTAGKQLVTNVENGYRYHNAGIKVKTLKRSIRNPVAIAKVLQTSISVIKESSTEFVCPP